MPQYGWVCRIQLPEMVCSGHKRKPLIGSGASRYHSYIIGLASLRHSQRSRLMLCALLHAQGPFVTDLGADITNYVHGSPFASQTVPSNHLYSLLNRRARIRTSQAAQAECFRHRPCSAPPSTIPAANPVPQSAPYACRLPANADVEVIAAHRCLFYSTPSSTGCQTGPRGGHRSTPHASKGGGSPARCGVFIQLHP